MSAIDIKVVIPSRHRATTVQRTLRLVPDGIVTVNESEVDDYVRAGVPREQILPHPESNVLADVRNWIMDNVDADFLWQIDDDSLRVELRTGWRTRKLDDPVAIRELLESTSICCRDAGAYLCGFSQDFNATHDRMRPIAMTGWVASVFGLVRGHGLRCEMPGHPIIDMSLQSLQKHRIIWKDLRVCWKTLRYQANTAGGTAGRRSAETNAEANRAMLEKWGRYISIKKPPNNGKDIRMTMATAVSVRRSKMSMVES